MEKKTRIAVNVLGPFEVFVDGVPAEVSGPKRTLLLAALALQHGRVVAVDALLEHVWELEDPGTTRNALHHHVARLRAALGRDAIAGSAAGYALAAECDAAVCERSLAEAHVALRDGDTEQAEELALGALALWRGRALQGLADDTLWLRVEAQRLEELRLDALEARFEASLALGRHRECISELEIAVEASPFRERLRQQLMLALYRSGRQADALHAYRTARQVFVERLGLEPGPELRHLQDAILSHDPVIAGPVGRSNWRRDELGRIVEQLRAELRRAEELYARAHHGTPELAFA